jgi:hypothetical protein
MRKLIFPHLTRDQASPNLLKKLEMGAFQTLSGQHARTEFLGNGSREKPVPTGWSPEVRWCSKAKALNEREVMLTVSVGV